MELYQSWQAWVRKKVPQCPHPEEECWYGFISMTRVLTQTSSNSVSCVLNQTGSNTVSCSLGLISNLDYALIPLKEFCLLQNPSYWNQATMLIYSPMILYQMSNWSLITTRRSLHVCWSMELLFLPNHINSLLMETWDALKVFYENIIRGIFVKTKLPPPCPSQINHEYTGMCCLRPSILWIQGWINQWYLTMQSFTHWGKICQDRWYYGCTLSKG